MKITYRFHHVDHGTVEVMGGPFEPGYAPLGPCDVYASNETAGIAYGDLNPDRISGPTHFFQVEVERLVDGVPDATPRMMAAQLDHGTQYSTHFGDGTYVTEKVELLAKWRAWYIAQHEHLSEQALSRSLAIGPNPDPNKTESTGSGRLWSHRCPYTLSVLTGHDQKVSEARRWMVSNGGRGLYFYDSRNNYEPYLAKSMHYIGGGYGSTTGGFSTLYSSMRPTGVNWGGVGGAVPHATHLTIDGLIACGYLYGDLVALRMAIQTMQAVGTSLLSGESWSSRAFGRWFKSLADLAPAIRVGLPGTSNLVNLARISLSALQSRNYAGAPAPDNGWTSEGGHLTGNEVYAILGPKGYDQYTCKQIGRSENVWMTGQLCVGLMSFLTLWEGYGLLDTDIRSRAEFQLTQAAQWIAKCGEPMLRLDGGANQTPKVGQYGYLDDRSTWMGWGNPIGDGGEFNNWPLGTAVRFLAGALAELSTWFGDEEWFDSAKKILDKCRNSQHYNGDPLDWSLEVAPALPEMAKRGWPL